MGIQIRPAALHDAFDACHVLRRSITESCAIDHQQQPDILQSWLGNKTPENVASWIASPSNYTLVAVRDGQVVGVALVTQAGKLSLCYLLPGSATCLSIGKALLRAVEGQAREWGVSVLRLHSTATARLLRATTVTCSLTEEKSCYGVECDFFWKKLNADASNDQSQSKRFCSCSAQ
ncbi:GNAT family N-acetyltransferase [Massilia sp. H-1]|nr:GNAT family N-acetyltransferase [Massilia sp. H-1]